MATADAGIDTGFEMTTGKIVKRANSAKEVLKTAKKVAKDVTYRPFTFRKRTVQDAWDEATPGSKACPTCGKDVEVAQGQGRIDWITNQLGVDAIIQGWTAKVFLIILIREQG